MHPHLTPRETDVLARLQLGERNIEIAAALAIRPATVAIMLKKLFRKYRVSTRTELVVVTKYQGRDLTRDQT
jgi:DNA-binding CsgD family transcriptional regulator